MKALVCVKRVIDYNVKPRVKSDGSGVDLANVKMSMNPFDEIAVEEAIRLREKGVVTEIIALSVGPAKAAETLRTALAMGADRAVLIQLDDGVEAEPLAVAKLVKAVAEEEGAQLIITGKQAIDDDSNQVGQMVAALMGRPQGTFANEVAVEGDSVVVKREVDGGLETVKLALPAPAIFAAASATAPTPDPATSRWTSPSCDAAVTVASVASLTAPPSCSTRTSVFIMQLPSL